ncbi:probable peptidoglycan muropeptide transporter SLC46 [Planococcus citri]|uniref:probable peptidoglycan muropeptide transporter SLC46 n=1 Tax=Planococcus citri TaxID=170843 RepID=UPI0031FA3763
MEVSDNENEYDRALIVDNEVTENPGVQNDFHGVIYNPKPRKHLIEPAVFLLFAGFTLYELVLPNTVELQYCRTVLNLTQDQCFNKTLDLKVKAEYEKFASTFSMYRSIIEVAIPFLITFFVGPWSDTYGRKPLILSALIGYSVTYSLWTFASSIPSLPPFYFLFFSLPVAFSGGLAIFILGTYCYLCDVTALENRGARLGRFHAIMNFGKLIATLCVKLLPPDYTLSYGVSSMCMFLALFYIYLFLDDSVVPSQVELNSPKRNPFHLHHIRELYECCYTKQTPKIRWSIFLLLLIMATSSISAFGDGEIMYLFLQRTLNFDINQYAMLNTFVIIVNACGSYGGTWLLCSKLQLNDLLVLSIAVFPRLLSALVMVFGYQLWHIYLAITLSCTFDIPGSILRLFLSRIVGKDELGKVFSLLSTSQSITPMFAAMLYSTVFNLTIATMPGVVFFLSAILFLFVLVCLVVLVKMYVPDSTRRSLAVTEDTSSH